MNHELIKLCVDTVRGEVTKFSAKEGNDVIRKAFVDMIGTDKITPKVFRKHAIEIFEIIEEVVEQTIVDSSIKHTEFYNQFVEEKNLKLGDANSFYVPNNTQVTVAKYSGNHWDLNRQRIDEGQDFIVKTEAYGVKVYEHFQRFLAGRIDFVALVAKIQEAVDKYQGEAVYAAFMNATTNLPSEFKYAGSYNEDSILKVLERVGAVNGTTPVLVGTRTAIAKLQGTTDLSDSMKDEKNAIGHLKYWNGYQCIVLPQVLRSNSFEFAFDDSKILCLTADTKPIKLVNEGDVLVQEVSDGTTNMDMTIEYAIQFKMGIMVMFNRLFGTLQIS